MKKNSNGLLSRTQFGLSALCMATTLSAFAAIPASAADIPQIKSLSGLSLEVLDGTIRSNCSMASPELCHSRKDINISPNVSAFLNESLAKMIPGQERLAKINAEIKALSDENESLKGTGQELKISKNAERIAQLSGDSHPDYAALHITPLLWTANPIELGATKAGLNYANLRHNIYYGLPSFRVEHVHNNFLAKGDYRKLKVGSTSYEVARDITYAYSPSMGMSLVIKVYSTASGLQPGSTEYALEEMVARCSETRIFNTIASIKTSLEERHLLCKLPENLGSLRFRVLENL